MKTAPKKMAVGGPVGMPTQAAAGMARRPAMPAQSNAGGAMRGQERAAAMSGRTFDQGVGYAKGGMIGEYGGKEKYASKAAMAKHEKKESPAKEKAEKMKAGGMVKGKKC